MTTAAEGDLSHSRTVLAGLDSQVVDRTSCGDSGPLLNSQKQNQRCQGRPAIPGSESVHMGDLGSLMSTKLSPDRPDDGTGRCPEGIVQSLTKNGKGCVGSSKDHRRAPHKQVTPSLRVSLTPQTPTREGHEGQGWFNQLGQGVVTPVSIHNKTCGAICSRSVSSPASVTKRNVKGETLLHLAAIKVSLLDSYGGTDVGQDDYKIYNMCHKFTCHQRTLTGINKVHCVLTRGGVFIVHDS